MQFERCERIETRRGAARILLTGTALIGLAATSAAQKLERLPTQIFPRYSSFDDFDGDGLADHVHWTGGAARGFIVFRRGDGTGTFGSEVASPSYGEYFAGSHYAPRAVDIDRDGTPDVFQVIAHRIVLQHGLGNGALDVPFVAHNFYGDDGFLVAYGPIDAVDDEVDFISANVLYRGDGTGHFFPGEPFLDEPLPLQGATVADIDGDGRMDVFAWRIGSVTGLRLRTLLGGPRGGFHLAWSFDRVIEGFPTTFRVAIGDVSGDGRADLVIAGSQTRELLIALGDGSGAFLETELTRFDLGRAPRDLDLADLDLDGTLDVVATSAGRFAIVRADGLGGFVAPRYVSLEPNGSECSVVQIDGDGRPDLVFHCSLYGTGRGFIFLNRTERVREAR